MDNNCKLKLGMTHILCQATPDWECFIQHNFCDQQPKYIFKNLCPNPFVSSQEQWQPPTYEVPKKQPM